MKRQLLKIMLLLLVVSSSLLIGACAYVKQPKFGSFPAGDRLKRIEESSNYAIGEFKNLVPTSMLTENHTLASVLIGNLFIKSDRLTPSATIRTVKTNLKALSANTDLVVWLGHSSYFVQIAGKRILIDPVFSSYAAPVSFANKAFAGSKLYSADDMPNIDYLLITHDHWDHLDYPSVIALAPKVGKVVGGLGIGGYFEQWGYPEEKIHEADWFTSLELEQGLIIHVLPARHYSGRLLTRNKTLWSAYALESANRRIFFSGDSGYGPHFSEIGRRFDGFDLVVLDSGQYDKRWANIHMTPEEAAQAADELRAKALLPAHVGKFTLAKHAWDEPFTRISAASVGKNFRLLTPMIGEPVNVEDANQRFSPWWDALQ